jgi:putative Mn2+ efflux pump MntP
MNIFQILIIAIGLAMDAFAVSLASGASRRLTSKRATFRLSFHFGLFQFMMPVLGWFMGLKIAPLFGTFDHWIAAGLLVFVGIRMIRAAFSGIQETYRQDPSKGINLVILSVATSIDALAIGLSLAMLNINIWYPGLIIGIITGFLSVIGIKLGKKLGIIFGRKMEFIGGMILIFIALKILAENIF